MNLRNAFFVICLLTSAPYALAQSADDNKRPQDAEWMSYRDAYRTMLWFEKYGKAKNLIQLQLQVVPKDNATSIDNLRLHIVGKKTHLDLALDTLGRTSLPLLKAAYDENAELVINQKAGQAGFRFRTSIIIRPDGIYELADLRAACEQALAYQSYVDYTAYRGKRCIGVRFAFAKKDSVAMVEFKYLNQNNNLPINDNTAIWPDSAANFRTSNVIFGAAGNVANNVQSNLQIEKGQIHTRTSPLAIIALIE
ncbi:hypothetical protein [Undibacterium flavidum]|uniref:Uncharacterized protein n=1 Tax=Undibacterium flavidum TaxID=2762297 RepID=A0ABR6YGE6_9BURK|nr:hypothetical protein [Undibacterium flavidum]MBC3875606.1 hypothetical protein [Undibacterium flavidum]